MKIAKIGLVFILGGVLILSGCGVTSKGKETSTKTMPKPQAQSVKVSTSSISLVTNLTKEAVPENPGVTRVILTLDKEASYSTSRNEKQLIVNVFNARMTSSIKQLEVRDPVIKSITAKQVGNSVKGIIELINEDVAYTPSTSSNPFQILVDIWPISPTAALQKPSIKPESATIPISVQPIGIEVSQKPSPEVSEPPKVKEVTLDVRKPSDEKVTPALEITPTPLTSTAPTTQDLSAQLQWFSAKLSEVLQEREKLKQELLEAEKSFVVKDSTIQVLEKKVKEANNRIVELEEDLIKVKSRGSLAEQTESDIRNKINQLLAQLETALGEQVTPVSDPAQQEEIQSRSGRILAKIATLQQDRTTLTEIKAENEALKGQIAALTRERDESRAQLEQASAEIQTLELNTTRVASERDELRTQLEQASAEIQTLRLCTTRLTSVENELRFKDAELVRLRKAIGDAAKLAMKQPEELRVGTSTIQTVTAPQTEAGTQPVSQPPEETEKPTETQLVLADLIRQQQLSEQMEGTESYVLGPEDLIQIKVLKEENLDKTVTVSSDGFITFPLIGDLRVDGLTVEQLDAQITSLLARDFLVDPEVMVEVVKPRSKKVYIMGGVKQPGYYELKGDQRLLGTLLNAGGPTSFDSEVRILRLPKQEVVGTDVETLAPIVVDLNKLFVGGDRTQNIVLHDSDVLMVAAKTTSSTGAPLGEGQFYVVGSVVKPGIYNYQENDTVLDAILRAGGFTEFASRNNTKLVREADGKTQTFRVKMKEVMEKGEMDKNLPILPGDMIIVPESFF